ncbi:hypothetical protein CJD36_003050 [Flavipsychrobacter stenotrophus]|uniref:DNA mimic protein DMP19 C-terminal domain-containing protein n=1 Tax=Flavipsychrobacter stenotrophus TaxID=2077091 RepID=A0A2S7T0M1_9BACT|nr:DUF4375 domain-containing protein [Flavipsychrobacter stenotrophus]PQJ12740.1 hypothetical protein CJD36_003050 [Flavipsychrobacter stenotrophus]
MVSNFLPAVDKDKINVAYKNAMYDELYEMLVEPLHEELYKRQSFDFMDDLSPGQQLLLGYDYLRTQVVQGGFIQFIQNGYIGLMPSLIEQLNMVGAFEMAIVLDDVLKVYVLNMEQLGRTTTVEEFARLYEEFIEFEIIDQRYANLNLATEKLMLDYAVSHLQEFIAT